MRNILFVLITLVFTSSCIAQKHDKMIKNILSPYYAPTSYLRTQEGEVAYTEKGKGKTTILFVHGLSSNSDAWARNVEKLSDKYHCITIDLPGFGRTYKEAKTFTPTTFAQTIHTLLKVKKIKKVVLVGHSMGGQAAIKFSKMYPEMVDKLILIAPAGIEEFSEAESSTMKMFSTQAVFKATTDEQIEKNYLLNFYKMPQEAQQMIIDRKAIKLAEDFDLHTLAIEKSINGMLNDKVIEDIPSITIPTLVLFAENDMLIPNKYFHPSLKIEDLANKAKELFSNAMVKIIPESGHFLQFEKPEVVNQEIDQFISIK